MIRRDETAIFPRMLEFGRGIPEGDNREICAGLTAVHAKRRCYVVLALLATAGANPPSHLPEPPIPPAHPPTAQSAPTPNPDAQAPPSTEPQSTRVSLQDFRVNGFGQSLGYTLGYTPGSQFQTSEDKRSIQTPGVAVQVPLR